MKIELNTEALEAVSDLCQEDELEADIRLMEDSIDMLLSEEYPQNGEQVVDLVRSYRRLSKQFQTILNNVKK